MPLHTIIITLRYTPAFHAGKRGLILLKKNHENGKIKIHAANQHRYHRVSGFVYYRDILPEGENRSRE